MQAACVAQVALLCVGLASAKSVTITEFVVPQEAEVGGDVELKCAYTLEAPETSLFYVKWWWTPLDSSGGDERQQIYQRLGNVGRKGEPDKGQSTHKGLVIKENDTIRLEDLKPNNSGIYECEISNLDEIHRSQELIVYTPGTGPMLNLTTVQEGDDEDVVITCNATDVAPEPEMVITINGQKIGANTTIDGPMDGLYDIYVNASLEEVEEGATVSCELFYTNTKVKHVQYIESKLYEGSGAELTTAEPASSTDSQRETTTAAPAGSSTALSNSALLLSTTVAALLYVKN